jgi:hypothetical protein
MIPLHEIEPPFRLPEWQRDFHGFFRARMVLILTGFVADADIEPILLFSLPQLDSYLPAPFRYRVRDGFHRFYASVAAGFKSVPALQG